MLFEFFMTLVSYTLNPLTQSYILYWFDFPSSQNPDRKSLENEKRVKKERLELDGFHKLWNQSHLGTADHEVQVGKGYSSSPVQNKSSWCLWPDIQEPQQNSSSGIDFLLLGMAAASPAPKSKLWPLEENVDRQPKENKLCIKFFLLFWESLCRIHIAPRPNLKSYRKSSLKVLAT